MSIIFSMMGKQGGDLPGSLPPEGILVKFSRKIKRLSVLPDSPFLFGLFEFSFVYDNIHKSTIKYTRVK